VQRTIDTLQCKINRLAREDLLDHDRRASTISRLASRATRLGCTRCFEGGV
jgi:hypothetical protein